VCVYPTNYIDSVGEYRGTSPDLPYIYDGVKLIVRITNRTNQSIYFIIFILRRISRHILDLA
jgi:hypothetical protein